MPFGASPGLGEHHNLLASLLLHDFHSLNSFVGGNGECGGLWNGAINVLLASLGGMLGRMIRLLHIAWPWRMPKFACISLPSLFSFLKHFYGRVAVEFALCCIVCSVG